MTIGIYVRVSTNQQSIESQLPDLKRWVEAFGHGKPVRWYKDKATGKSMDRPAWNECESALDSGMIRTLVVWRLDRLGRTASGLTSLFDKLVARKTNFVSIKDGIDLATPAGRLMANVLASVAAYETEVRSERQLAGVAQAKAAGKYKGRKLGATKAKPHRAIELRKKGANVDEICSALGISRRTYFRYMKAAEHAELALPGG